MKVIRKLHILITVAVLATSLFLLILALGNYLVISSPINSPDAIVVLSGAADYEERIIEAARLFHNGTAPRIVLTNDGVHSSWSEEHRRNLFFVEKSGALLVDKLVPENAIEVVPGIIDDEKAIGTVAEAKLVLAFSRERGYSRLLIVTSAYHSRRALSTYIAESAKSGKKPEIGITHPSIQAGSVPHPLWLFYPGQWAKVVGEYAKIILGDGTFDKPKDPAA